MVILRIGTAGWEYKDWYGIFYPKNLDPSRHLEFYSKYFHLTEVNSTFYNIPSKEMVLRWNNRVPANFRFTIKIWQKITHKSNCDDLDYYISQFFSQLSPLSEKLSIFLFQFPPWFKYSDKHLEKLKKLLNLLPNTYIYAIEFRDNSWFDNSILGKIINGSNIILATSYIENVIPYYYPNQNYYYIRLIGDRELTTFNRVQRIKKKEIDHLQIHIEKLINNDKIKEIFIIVNNHFTGFSPETVNTLKKRWNLPFQSFSQQKNMFDFL